MIRDNPNSPLKKISGLGIEKFELTSSFITDCASTMPRVFGASVSINNGVYSHRWAACLTHQRKTVMKSILESKGIELFLVAKDMAIVKSIVRTLKHVNVKDELAESYVFTEEVSTRFGKTFMSSIN